MLRKRSRPVSSSSTKQATACDHNTNRFNFPNPSSEKSHKPTSFLFNSPRIFKDFFSSKDPIMSPSSVLDTKPFSSSGLNPQRQKTQNPKAFSSEKHSWEQPTAIGLALIDDEKGPQMGPTNTAKPSKQRTKLVVFGSHLKIQIPPPPLSVPTSPQSPMEFGIKTPKSNLFGHVIAQQEEESLSVEDMELSEDYTCVISHGPNPKTTHIFGNCIVKSCCGVVSNTSASTTSTKNRFSYGVERETFSHGNRSSNAYESISFLSFCHHCNKKIGQGKDIYMYRGEKAFCSQECRCQEMLSDGIEC